jgi:hypothetical protein
MDPRYADHLLQTGAQGDASRGQPKLQPRQRGGIANRLRNSYKFTLDSFKLQAISWIPVVGSIYSSIMHLFLIAETIASDMLLPFFNAKHMTERQQQDYLTAHRWLLVGFGIPFAVLGAVPLLGPLAQLLGPAAAAHLLIRQLDPPTDVRRKQQLSAEVDREAQWMERLVYGLQRGTTSLLSTALSVAQRVALLALDLIRTLLQSTSATAASSSMMRSTGAASVFERADAALGELSSKVGDQPQQVQQQQQQAQQSRSASYADAARASTTVS